MELILCNRTRPVVDAWEVAFEGTPVTARCGDILALQADAIVSPANSFGYMDGGIDLVYSQRFGWDVETRLRARLLSEWHGELPVGNAVVVPITEGHGFRWLISAPTMRVPSQVADTANAFLAFRAALRAVAAHNQSGSADVIGSVACPGLCTGEGRMPPERCARQMRRAYDVVIEGQVLTLGGLAGAVRDHIALVE